MFRVLATLLALLLTVAPNTALLCRAWCDGAPPTGMCQHDSDVLAETVAARHSCDDTLSPTPAVNELSKRTAPLSVGLAINVAPTSCVPSIIAARFPTPADERARLPQTPLVTVLRI